MYANPDARLQHWNDQAAVSGIAGIWAAIMKAGSTKTDQWDKALYNAEIAPLEPGFLSTPPSDTLGMSINSPY